MRHLTIPGFLGTPVMEWFTHAQKRKVTKDWNTPLRRTGLWTVGQLLGHLPDRALRRDEVATDAEGAMGELWIGAEVVAGCVTGSTPYFQPGSSESRAYIVDVQLGAAFDQPEPLQRLWYGTNPPPRLGYDSVLELDGGTLGSVQAWRKSLRLPHYPCHAVIRSWTIAALISDLIWCEDLPAGLSYEDNGGLARTIWAAHDYGLVPRQRDREHATAWLSQAATWTEPARPSGSSARLWPAPRLIADPRQSEEYAAEIMCALGFTDARPTPAGTDGGIDVASSGALAQVKYLGVPVGAPALQSLYGVAQLEGKSAVFFSLGGFTASAADFARRSGMILFTYDRLGGAVPASDGAARLLAQVPR